MTNLTHSFSVYLFHASTCFDQQVLIIRKTNLYQYIIWYNTLWWVAVWWAGQEESYVVISRNVHIEISCEMKSSMFSCFMFWFLFICISSYFICSIIVFCDYWGQRVIQGFLVWCWNGVLLAGLKHTITGKFDWFMLYQMNYWYKLALLMMSTCC